MLIVSYNPMLVLAAAALALMAAFTGLSLTNGLSRLDVVARKARIVRAAVVIGGGIWATHFVAMLALDLPIAVFYDPVYTLASALIAILLAGLALLLLHFGERSNGRIVAAGVIMGLGVVVMHYVGMYGMRGCETLFYSAGYVVSTLIAVAMSIGALSVAYRVRTPPALAGGAVIYGLAILAMHFSAMYWTGFVALEELAPVAVVVSDDVLALFVVFVAFLICGAFLLTTVTVRENPEIAVAGGAPLPVEEPPAPVSEPGLTRLPYEADGATFLVPARDVVAIKSDGHYARLYRVGDELFCPIGISKLAEELSGQGFLRTHRSFLVNLAYVAGFERRKDQGVCLFPPDLGIDPIPVSRTNVAQTMAALGI
ncbi:MAG: MHYT domain-containing protein [Rhodobacter sp.]|nr:MHYT domain-containing protein [Rhodobacter sp.]